MTGSLAGPTFSKTKFLNGDYKIEFKCNVQEDRPLLFTWDTPRSGGFYDTHRLYIPVGEYTLEKIKTEDEETISIIEIGETKVLIPADATYEVYSSSITSNKYNYILIPHHGCYYPPAASLISAIVDDNTKGIVQSGFNFYGHPDINHLNQYNNKPIYLHTTLTYNRKIAHHTEHHSKIDYYPICF